MEKTNDNFMGGTEAVKQHISIILAETSLSLQIAVKKKGFNSLI